MTHKDHAVNRKPFATATVAPRRAAWPLALALLLVSAAAAAAQTPGSWSPATLSLQEAMQMARENNPGFLQQQTDVAVARSSVRSARGNLLPSASASNSYGYTASGARRFESVDLGTEPEIYSSSYSLGVNYQLSGSRLLQPGLERSRLQATERRVTGAAADLDAQVANQYLSVLQARDQVLQAEREVERTGEHVRLAQARLDVGAGTPLDVRRAEVQQGRAQVSLVQSRNAAFTAVAVLSQLLGVQLEEGVELTSEFSIFQPEWEAESLVAMALQNNPGLMAARANQSAAGTGVSAARSAYLPSLSFNAGVVGSVYQAGEIDGILARQIEGMERSFAACQNQNLVLARVNLPLQQCLNPGAPGFSDQLRSELQAQNRGFPFDYERQPLGASVTISLPLFTGFSRQLEVDRARAAAADAGYAVRAEELRLRQEVATAVRNLETAHQTVLLQEQVRGNASEELRLAQERFRFGAANSVEVTDAQTNLSQAERELVDAVYNFHKSLATLEALVGRPLR
jgi:outer membrane protein